MRFITPFIVLLLMISSCKTIKNRSSHSAIKSFSTKKIIKKHQSVSFDAATLEAKFKVEFSNQRGDKKNRNTFTVRLRMQKDSVIWMKGSKVIPGFKVKITPSSFSYYSYLTKEYFEGDYSLIEQLLGTKISFNQIQNVLLGETILDLKKKKYLSKIEHDLYKLTPKIHDELYRIFFFFNADNFKLKKQLLEMNGDNQSLSIEYGSYISLDNQLVPKKIHINAVDNDQNTNINIDCRSLTLNKRISTPYKIPSNYKRIKL